MRELAVPVLMTIAGLLLASVLPVGWATVLVWTGLRNLRTGAA